MRHLLIVLALVACGGSSPEPAKPAVGAHRFAVPADPGALVVDAAAFAAFAKQLRADTEADVRAATNPKFLKDRRFALALLDALDERWTDAVAELDQIRKLETEPRQQIMTGLTIRLWSEALQQGGSPEAFAAALDRHVKDMPLDVVRDDLSMLRTMGQVFSPEVCKKLVSDSVRVQAGTVDFDDAQGIAFQRYAVVRLVPVGAAIDRVLGERGIAAKSE